MEKCDTKRALFIQTLKSYPHQSIYHVDECGFNTYLYREHAYSLRGIPIIGKVSGRKFKRTNIVAAKCGNTLVAPMIYNGTTDSVLFETWFEYGLLRSIHRQSVIVLDNATFHRKAKLRELAEAADCIVLFLPPYSPDLNPIEKYWAWLKRKLRDILPSFDCFEDALVECFHVN